MNFAFLQNAVAAGTAASDAGGQAAPAGGGFMSFGLLILIFIAFYFLLLRPQSKRQKEHRKMVEALAKGDEVITSGGMLARVTQVGEQFLTVEVANGVELKVQRSSVSALMPKGTIKNT
jgi:preprotein translocase subunit YajC